MGIVALRGVAWSLLVLVLGCLETASVPCDDGRICPTSTVCDEANHTCVRPEQLASCVGLADQTDCNIGGRPIGICRTQVCLEKGCGDGFATGSEHCDLNDQRGVETCDQLGFHTTAPVTCRADCTFEVEPCREAGACGDGIAQEGPEECDLSDLAGETCTSLGFHGGTLSCLSNCRFNRLNCIGTCGDGALNGGELCDGTDFGGRACTSLGFYTGSPTCSSDCATILTSTCAGFCGDNTRNGPEACDGTDVGGDTCANHAFYTGSLACDQCSIVTTGCSQYCGDGEVNGGELCDGLDQTGNTCASFGARGGPLSCNGFCQPGYARCHWAAWRKSLTNTTSDLLFDVWAGGPDDVWAVGNLDLAHFDGARWTRTDLGVGLRGIWGAATNDVWAVGTSGAIWRYDGTGWAPFAVGMTTEHLTDVWGSGANDVWISGDNGTVLRWNGNAWTDLTLPGPTPPRLEGIYAAAPNDVWVIGGTMYRHYNGTSWEPAQAASSFLTAIHGITGSDIWIVGYTGYVLHREGASWVERGPNNGPSLYAVHAAAANDVWITGESGTIRHWDGSGFTDVTSNTSEFLYAVWQISSSDVWAAGTGKTAVHYDGPGWTGGPFGSEYLSDVVMLGPHDGFTAGISGGIDTVIFRYDGAHASWNLDHVATNTNIWGMWANGANDVWAVGSAGKILRRTAAGWGEETSGTTERLNDVWGSGGVVWAVGDAGTIRKYTTASGWVAETSPTTMTLNAVWGSSPTNIWAVGVTGAVVRYDGLSWTNVPVPTGQILTWVWGTGPSDVWAGGAGALLHHDGTSWTAEGPPISTLTTGAWGTRPTDIWVVGGDGTASHYDGTRWSQYATGTPGQLLEVAGTASDDVWIVGENRTLLHWAQQVPGPGGGTCNRPIALYCDTTVFGGTLASDANRLASYDGCAGARDDAGGEVYYELVEPDPGRHHDRDDATRRGPRSRDPRCRRRRLRSCLVCGPEPDQRARHGASDAGRRRGGPEVLCRHRRLRGGECVGVHAAGNLHEALASGPVSTQPPSGAYGWSVRLGSSRAPPAVPSWRSTRLLRARRVARRARRLVRVGELGAGARLTAGRGRVGGGQPIPRGFAPCSRRPRPRRSSSSSSGTRCAATCASS